MRTSRFIMAILAGMLALIVLFPFAYALMASFFAPADFATSPAPFLPSQWRWGNYTRVLTQGWFPTYIMNSLVTGLLSTTIRSLVAFLAAYAFSHFRFRFSKAAYLAIVLTLFIPGDLLLSGNYQLIQDLHLLDSYIGIISTSLLGASQIIMLTAFMRSIPTSIHESALMDGTGDWDYSFHILVPLSRAVISTFLLQGFVSMFNSYLWPLIVTNSPAKRTVQIGITMLGYAESLDLGPVFAAIIIVFIPFLITFIAMRKRIMEALRQGYMNT